MPDVVLDASVVLAAVFREEGHEVVLTLPGTPLVSTVNLAEVRARLSDQGVDRDTIDSTLDLVNMRPVDFDPEQAALSADLRNVTRSVGLSLGDRACLALAMQRGAVAYTADRAWASVELPVAVKLVR
jgi:ribonuclease VapC